MNVFRFRQLVRAVLLSAAPASVVACSDDPTEMPERAQCFNALNEDRYTRLTLGPNVDGIAFATRGQETFVSTPDPGSSPASALPSLGTPCARATDPGGCDYRVKTLLADPTTVGWSMRPGGRVESLSVGFVDLGVITAGDDVRVATFDDVLTAVSPIDTRDEAMAVLLVQGGFVDCSDNNVRPEANGWTFKATNKDCDGAVTEIFTRVDREGKLSSGGTHVVTKGDNSCVDGRRPPNLAPTHAPWLSSLAACFSEIAHMEAASVLAFEELDRQLRALSAPSDLLARVARARRDEVEHAALTTVLASRFGGHPSVPRIETGVDEAHENAWLKLALENAVEGCVREAYGALIAAHQAAHASDPPVRAAFARIAIDETEHAELSFALDVWLREHLSAADRALVDAAAERAWRDLEVACVVEPAREVVVVAGMPTAARARALLTDLRFASFSQAA